MQKQALIKKIKKNFPSLIFKKSELLTHGWNKEVIVLDDKIVFTFPKNNEAKRKFKSEVKILPILCKKIKLPIPNCEYVPSDQSFSGYRLIQGIPLTFERFRKLKTGQQNIIAKQIGEFLNQLHSFSVVKAKKNAVTLAWTEKDARTYYKKQAKIVSEKLSVNDREILKNILTHFCQDQITEKFKKTLVHQDLTSDHLLLNEKTKKVSGIIDFGDIQISDPAVDFSKLWEYGENFIDKVLKGYRLSDKTLKERSWRWYIYQCVGNMFCGITMKRKDYWEKGYDLIKLFKVL
jgi:aminoglycoside 2''-phosphotransferase